MAAAGAFGEDLRAERQEHRRGAALVLDPRDAAFGAAACAAPPHPRRPPAPHGDGRAARRANAQTRQRLAPLRKIVKAAEQKMTRLQADQERIAKALADPALYQDTPDKLAGLNQQRAQTDKAIAEAEAAWLAAEEELEAAQA